LQKLESVLSVVNNVDDIVNQEFVAIYVVRCRSGELLSLTDVSYVVEMCSRDCELVQVDIVKEYGYELNVIDVIKSVHDIIVAGYAAVYVLRAKSGEVVFLANSLSVEEYCKCWDYTLSSVTVIKEVNHDSSN